MNKSPPSNLDIRQFLARALAFVLAFAAPSLSSAMSFDPKPPLLYLAGRIATSDWPAWEQTMERYTIDTVVLGHSPGGDSATGRRIGSFIRAKGIKTVVAGRCMSACGSIFLGGVERQFIASHREQPTVLGFHGTYTRTGELIGRPVDYFLSMTDGKMGDDLAKSFTAIDNRKGALYFIHRAQRSNDTQALAYFCAGEEVDSRRDELCVNRMDLDAVTSGVLTTWELRDVPSPSFRPTKRQFEKGVTIKAWE